jgi:hypothetical protein
MSKPKWAPWHSKWGREARVSASTPMTNTRTARSAAGRSIPIKGDSQQVRSLFPCRRRDGSDLRRRGGMAGVRFVKDDPVYPELINVDTPMALCPRPRLGSWHSHSAVGSRVIQRWGESR